MSDQLPKLIKIRDSTLRRSQSLYGLRQLLSPLIRILIIDLFLILLEKPLFLHKRVVNELIIQEFVEDIQLFDQELIEGVDDCTHDTDTVGFYTIEHLINANGLDLSRFLRSFHKMLRVYIVIIFRYELAKLTKHL